MTHLIIELNTITENVTSNVIHKLYETAKAIIDAEEANEVQESLVSLKGNLLVSKAYGDEIDWLEAKFPDLHITAGARYIRFEDPEVERICVNVLNWGDGTGCTEDDLYAINTVSGSVFGGNTSITTFNELQYFKPTAFNQTGLLKGCSSLTEVTLPSGTPYIGQDMFTNCSNLTTIRNTESITEIKGLCNCSKLVSINTPNLISVGNWGCSGCTLLSTIDTSNVTSIGRNAFLNCTSLTSVDLSSCTSIDANAFLGCTSLTSIDVSKVLSGNLSSTFEGCTSLTSVTLPSTSFTWGNNTENHKSMFYGCTSLASIDMSNATFIGLLYFQGCTALTTCIWPTSVTTIPVNCFYGCTNLESLGSKISPTQVNVLAFRDCNKLTLDDIDLSSIITIENGAFRNSGISGVVNLTNCTYIGEVAFNDCAVTEIHGPNVTSISSWSIYSLPTLLVLDLPVCSKCPSCPCATSLTTLNVPSATSFGLYGDLSLTDCRNLTTLNIPFENLTGVGSYAFLNCVGLSGQTFDFGTNLQYIGIEAFMNTSINIVLRGNSVVPAQDRSFVLYSGLIYVPDELVETYKTSTGYSSVSSQIKGISELPST